MKTVVLDLEWNGGRCRESGGIFNEIIEIGAVSLNERMCPAERFHRVIRPRVCTKLTPLVKKLTRITPDELKTDGEPFEQAMDDFVLWMGGEITLFTWSRTDLLVLLENFRFFYEADTIPFMRRYADIQVYCQKRLGADTANQMALGAACERLGISAGDTLHRAHEDAWLTASVFSRLYEPGSFAGTVQEADGEFYRKLLFKPYVIGNMDDPSVRPEYFRFVCPSCGVGLNRQGKWAFRSCHFRAELKCPCCKTVYIARVQLRQTADAVKVKRKLAEKLPKPDEAPFNTPKVRIQESSRSS